MTTLFLLRHAKAAKASPGMRDFDRPLEESGREDARQVGLRFRAELAPPSRVLCSAAARTRETLATLDLAELDERATFSTTLFDADANGYLREIKAQSAQSLLVIGHNPAIAETAMLLTRDGEAAAVEALARDFPTSTLAVLSFDAPLSRIEPHTGFLHAVIVPKRD